MEGFQSLPMAVGNHTISRSSWFHEVLQAVGVRDYKLASDVLVVVSALLFVVLTLLPKWFSNAPVGEKPVFPPSPQRWPILGNMPQILRDGAALHTTLRLLGKKMGPIYTLWLGRY